MIQMPRRSVTRFFIPLIDVLILLFCIFLLMEFNSETEVDKQVEVVAEQSESIDLLQAELLRRVKELQQFEEDRPKLQELAKLRKDLEALQKLNLHTLQQRTFFRVIDIDRHTGALAFYDETRPDQPIKLDEKSIQPLLERHQKESQGRELYYYFMRTRPSDEDRKAKKLSSGHPTKGEINRYKKMFAGVANNLAEYR